ncbi:hypothetical protein PI126_g8810 [Phytophthora idaei]|nr:hypothetical protein PI126_g8810 [Phytophthora idaei]
MVVDVGYLLVLLRAVLWRNLLVSSSTRSKAGTWASSRILRVIGPSYKRGRQLWKELTSYEERNRKRWVSNLCIHLELPWHLTFDVVLK